LSRSTNDKGANAVNFLWRGDMSTRKRKLVSNDSLNQMQWYLGEETVEDFQDGLISRRAMLKRLIVICGGSAAAATVLTACNVPVSAPPAAPAEKPAESQSTPSSSATATAPAAAEATTAATRPPQPTPGPATGPLTVPVDDPAVKGEDISYKGAVDMLGYLARPTAEGTYPGVIVIHENRGLNDHIRDVARRLAKAGYVALAPDLVSRAGGGTAKLARDQIGAALSQAKPEDLVSDLSASVDHLLKQAGVKQGKVGVVGFCFGGAYTLRLAAANPNIGAAVCYYGVTPQPAAQMANTNAAILGQYGGNDARVNGTIPDLEKVLKDAGKTFEKNIYEGANHAFNNDTGANWNEQAAVTAWKATLDWFGKNL
jgi:carboxymethylenebutenolidase